MCSILQPKHFFNQICLVGILTDNYRIDNFVFFFLNLVSGMGELENLGNVFFTYFMLSTIPKSKTLCFYFNII